MSRTLFILIFLPSSLALAEESKAAMLDFNRDVRPILSDRCFHCHGPDAKNQRSPLRLDNFENAIMDHDGVKGIVPGNPDDSEIIYRIESDDPDEIMPPPNSKLQLSAAEKKILRDWVAQGGEYDKHWSFKPITKPQLPEISAESKTWVRNPIDHFVAARLEAEALKPAAEAAPIHLRRRTALTLTGLNPADGTPTQHSEQIAHHLASFDYAERQALDWLDAARYADTDGYQTDNGRNNWPWRDWVIKAFKENMPFDQFTLEQLAGDMLPDATTHQKIASAFNRNHRQNAEGGALAEEFFVENVIDRVETTATVWFGLTMGCARCHDHKYDPFTQKEFFQLYAYFNNIGERGTGKGISANPILRTTTPIGEAPPELTANLEAARQQKKDAEATLLTAAVEWAKKQQDDVASETSDWTPTALTSVTAEKTGKLVLSEDKMTASFEGKAGAPTYSVRFKLPRNAPLTGLRIDCLPRDDYKNARKLAPSSNGNFVITKASLQLDDQADNNPIKDIPLRLAQASFTQDAKKFGADKVLDNNPATGWAIYSKDRKSHESLHLLLEKPLESHRKAHVILTLEHTSPYTGHHPGKLRLLTTTANNPALENKSAYPPTVLAALKVPSDKWNRNHRKHVTDHLRKTDVGILAADKAIKSAESALVRSGFGEVPVMVMQEAKGIRPAYLLDRGQYDAPIKDEELTRALPAAIFPEGSDMPANRLDLAQWMISDQNPLTARVIVNRVWQQHWGIGLVKTAEDFGLQGELPSHPKLLDWLAATFVESGWDLNALHTLILSSATYRQSSKFRPAIHQRDPENRLLARGPRYRVDGFVIRDNALMAAGLLNPKVGGPPVKPYQPAGLWNSVAGSSGTRYPMDKGDKLYRKSIYTYWKRAVNPPRQIIFDASGREACNVRKRVTNTPLQALVLMNDRTFLEAARALAQHTIKNPGAKTDDARIQHMAQRTLARQLSPKALDIVRDNLTHFRQRYTQAPEDATAFLKQGNSPRDESIPVGEHAAFTAVAHLLLNLDETLTLQ